MKLTRKTDTAAIHLLVDKSGSMNARWDDTLGSVNEFIKAQQDAGSEATLLISTFGSAGTYTTVYEGSIKDAPSFDRSNMPCNGGMTALLDSTMTALTQLKNTGAVRRQLVTITDGGENDSREYRGKPSVVREALEAARVDGIDVVALAVGAEAWGNDQIYGANNTIRATASAASYNAGTSYLAARSLSYASAADATSFAKTEKTVAFIDDSGNLKESQ